MWHQPINPLHWMALSALAGVVPLVVVLILMGWLRKPGYVAAGAGLVASFALACGVWRMPAGMALASAIFGAAYALWPIMWIVFAALWLYNLTVETGHFDLLRRWMEQNASSDRRVQAVMVAFCFGALLEGTAGFGSPVAISAFLLVALGFQAREALKVSLISNTAPVAFGALGIPIVALAGVTGLDPMRLSAMVGRQLPLLSALIPAYLILVISGCKGLRQTWPAALVAGGSFAAVQFSVANYLGPYAVDVLASLVSILALAIFLRTRPAGAKVAEARAAPARRLSMGESAAAWAPWAILAGVMITWSALRLFAKHQWAIRIPHLHNAVFITLYAKPYAAVYAFQPLAAGTAGLVAVLICAAALRVRARAVVSSCRKTARQLWTPTVTVVLIVALAYLYNYSGMAYTLGAALASLGAAFPFASSFLGWTACFLSGSDTSANLLFGNLQVAAAHRLGASPVLLAATNSSGAVTGKMISPQNIAVGVTTVGLVGKEGEALRSTFWHSVLFAAALGLLALAQAHFLRAMVP